MKRFASLATTAALAGSLIGAGTAAQADSTMYLVPISDINATYSAGATVKFAAVVNLGYGGFGSLSIPIAVAYLSSEFGTSRPTYASSSADPIFDLASPVAYSTTASVLGGSKIYSIQGTPGHSAQPNDAGTATVAVAAGIYTLGTFTFPISPANTGTSATVYLPTAFGYSNKANNTDGAFVGTAPTLSIAGKDILGINTSDPLTFPTTGKSLTFKVSNTPAPSSLLVVAMGAIPAVGVLRRRRAAK